MCVTFPHALEVRVFGTLSYSHVENDRLKLKRKIITET